MTEQAHNQPIQSATQTDLIRVADRLTQVETNLNQMRNTLHYMQQRMEQQYHELNYADLLHDTIGASPWLQDKTLSLFGWAANYSFIYLLYRILDKVQPTRILEMGLGQTTKLTTQYVNHKNQAAQLDVCEHSREWIDVYRPELIVCDRVHLHQMSLTTFEHNGRQNDKYADMAAVAGDTRFDLIIVDGPKGADQNLPRSDILDLIPNLADEFIIIMDDAERAGEQATIAALTAALDGCQKPYTTFTRFGTKTQQVITSPGRAFVQFL